ncbi:unnamed protein product [Ambrosiozyma monospora]|uniref:Unnamed protein product n=1 Tax=Ambrosiozyma monospora TaxID=43982 RepID=A0A9W6SZ64_AMBMO|nr:unnamed protein product [Ambrosiozyma monospora]
MKLKKETIRETISIIDKGNADAESISHDAVSIIKRKRGRPRKEPDTDGPIIKKKRGRPKKVHETSAEDGVSTDGNDTTESVSNDNVLIVKKSRGRPRKNPETKAEDNALIDLTENIGYVSHAKKEGPKKHSKNKTKDDERKVKKSHRPKIIGQKIPMKSATVQESLQITMEDLNPVVSGTFHKKVKDIWKVGQESKLKGGEE